MEVTFLNSPLEYNLAFIKDFLILRRKKELLCIIIMKYLVTYRGAIYVLALLIFGLNCTDADPPETWFEAQKSCSAQGKRLTTNNMEDGQHTYWTGRYHRISEWLKILGCFNDSDVENHSVKEAVFYNPSSGLCQEFCSLSNRRVFAIKGERCICLTANFEGVSNHPNNCNYTCRNKRDSEFATDCGGDNSFNVYSFEKKDVFSNVNTKFMTNSPYCLTLQCGNDPRYIPKLCSATLKQICQKPVNAEVKAWLGSHHKCKNASSYLLGNLSLSSANDSCRNKNNTGPLWIGIARQSYSGIDQGQNVTYADEHYFQQCQKCTKGSCSFVSCSDSDGINKVLCSEITLSTITFPTMTYPLSMDFKTTISTSTTRTTATRTTTTTRRTTPETWTDITEKNRRSITSDSINSSIPESHRENDTPVSSVVIPIVLALIIIGALAVGGVIFFRRCRQDGKKNSNSEYQKKQSPTENTEHSYNDIDKAPDSGYFVLQPQKVQGLSAVDETFENESPYNETEEGEYDHLGNNLSRRKVKEDTYCHASSTKDRGYSDYDVTNHRGQQNPENAYDHTDKYTDSDYGHSQQREAQDNYDYVK